MENIILANGAFPQSDYTRQLLSHAKHIICCDGAIEKLLSHHFMPTVIVGDGDSLNPADMQRWKSILAMDQSEEYNDLQKALKYCLSHQIDHITLLGCSGLRDDHFLANISIMATYSEFLSLRMTDDYGTFYPIRHTTTFKSKPGQQVSVFCKDEQLPITYHGLKYPVNHRCFHHLWEGSLNEAVGSEFTIEMHSEGVVLVYMCA